MQINWQARELNLKIVYYGPALSGKTTNLEQIYAHVDPQKRSELISLKTHEDRTLYFDFMQLELNKIGSLTPKIHLYTVPGQSYYEASRRLVLHGADGIVFVVDSGADRVNENSWAWADMKSHLAFHHISMQSIPVVVQFNKRDLSNALAIPDLKATLRIKSYPSCTAVAINGNGVFDTLKVITQKVITRIHHDMV
jgi:mutual gliding-motility protein MglA